MSSTGWTVNTITFLDHSAIQSLPTSNSYNTLDAIFSVCKNHTNDVWPRPGRVAHTPHHDQKKLSTTRVVVRVVAILDLHEMVLVDSFQMPKSARKDGRTTEEGDEVMWFFMTQSGPPKALFGASFLRHIHEANFRKIIDNMGLNDFARQPN